MQPKRNKLDLCTLCIHHKNNDCTSEVESKGSMTTMDHTDWVDWDETGLKITKCPVFKTRG